MNSIMVIRPYKYNGFWVFDDESVGLVREPFVAGIGPIIDILVENIPKAENGFNLIFSAVKFPGYQAHLRRLDEEAGGYWYRVDSLEMEGWLCPALFKYFPEAPENIYVQCS